jgi:hypothetical protein
MIMFVLKYVHGQLHATWRGSFHESVYLTLNDGYYFFQMA